jgi:hypothetical protein
VAPDVGERLLENPKRLRPDISQWRRGQVLSYIQANLEAASHIPGSPHQGFDQLAEGSIFFIFEAQVVDRLAEALGATPDGIDS